MDKNILSLHLISIEKTLYGYELHYTYIQYKENESKWSRMWE